MPRAGQLKDNPCYECGNRTSTCHASCKAYGTWAKDRETYRNDLNRERHYENTIDNHMYEAMQRNKDRRKARRKKV